MRGRRLHPPYSWGLALLLSLPLVSPLSLPGRAADLEAIEERGRLIVAVKDNTPPLGFRDAAGNLQGFEIDLARQLAAELLGDPDAVELRPMNNRDRLPAVLSGEVDLAIARLTATASRARRVDFSRHYYLDGTGFVTRQPGIQRFGDLAGRRILILEQSSTIAVVRHALPTADLVGVASYQAALAQLAAGQADAFAADRSLLAGWVRLHPNYRLLSNRLHGTALAIAMPRGLQYVELRREVNAAIARWQTSGWLQARQEYWGLP